MAGNYTNISFAPGRMELRNYAEEERRRRETAQLARDKTMQSAVLYDFYEYKRITEPSCPDETSSTRGKPPLRIWIDQICINQYDTVERSEQVRLMHEIYRHASEVLVCLGPDPDEHASRAFQLVQSLHSIFNDTLLAKLCKGQGASFDWIPPQYWRSLRELTRVPWFRRVWIRQEIGTDADATIYWGTESIDWNVLQAGMKKLETHGWELKKKHKIDTAAVTILFRRFTDSESPESTHAVEEQRSFVYQLCLSARNVATDPRDYVFSRLGHRSAWIESEQAMIIKPDYKNMVADVYHEISIRALTTDTTAVDMRSMMV